MNTLHCALLLCLLAAPAPDAESLYQEALYRRKILGDLDGALAALDDAASKDPHPDLRARVQAWRVLCLWDLKRFADATAAYDALGDVSALPLPMGVRERLKVVAMLQERQQQRREIVEGLEAKTALEREEKERLIAKKDREIEALKHGESPGPDMTVRLQKIAAEKARRPELLAEARRLEKEGNLEHAWLLLDRARRIAEDPKVTAALRRIGSLLFGGGARRDDVRRDVEFARAVRRDLAPRRVEELYRFARERFHEGDYDSAADLFGAVLEIRARYPELAELLVDRVVNSLKFLRQAIDRGARPAFAIGEDGKLEEGWVERLYEVFRDVGVGQETSYRIYPLARVMWRAEKDAPPSATGAAPVRVTRAGEYPVQALIELVKKIVKPGTWDGEDHAIHVAENRLVVLHDEKAQEDVRRFLTTLAGSPGPSVRIGFELVVLEPSDLDEITSALAVSFEVHGSAAVAVLDAAGLAVWERRTRRMPRVGRASGVTSAGRPLRLDAMRPENEIVGHGDDVLRGRAVNIPVLRPVREGARLDALILTRGESGTLVSIDGLVSQLAGPYALHSAGRHDLRLYPELERSFALAADIPAGGAMLLTGLANPFGSRHGRGVLSILVVPGGLPAAGGGGAADTDDGVLVSDLGAGEDAPGAAFLMDPFGEGPDRPHSAFELLGAMFGARGLTIEERSGVLMPVGDRSPVGREVLNEVMSGREDLFEIRARAISTPREPRATGAEITVEPDGLGRAWLTAADAPRTSGRDRLGVGRVTAGSLQRVHFSRVESHAYVREYESNPGHPGTKPSPVLGRVGRGIVLDVRALRDGDAILLSLLVRTARLESVGEESMPFGFDTALLPVSVPVQIVRRARVLTRMTGTDRLVVAGLPDPFGEGDSTVTVELEVRRISR